MKTFPNNMGIEQFKEKNQEIEAVIYGKITNPEGLKEASKIEHHLQYESNFSNGNRSRVRQTTFQGNVEHVLTLKKKSKQESVVSNSTEFNTIIDKDFFEGFVQTAAETKMDKIRHLFVLENVAMDMNDQTVVFPKVVYEVDVFKTDEGYCEWCKIDIELQDLLPLIESKFPGLVDVKFKFKISQLPLGLTDCFLNSNKTEDQAKLLDLLWDTKFKQKIDRTTDERSPEAK